MKNLLKFMLIFFIIAPMMLVASNVYAEHDNTGLYMQRFQQSNIRPTGGASEGEGGYYYYLGKDGNNKPAFKIVQTDEQGSTNLYYPSEAVYCLKNGIGFGVGTATEPVNYTEYFNMKAGLSEIDSAYQAALPSGENYNKLLWLLDNICLPYDETSRNQLLTNAGVDPEEFEEAIGNENELIDIIDVIQQTAIWSLTNTNTSFEPDINTSTPDVRKAMFSVSPTVSGTPGNIEDKYPDMDMVDSPIDRIFTYLTNYGDKGSYTSSEESIDFSFGRATLTQDTDYFYFGPYKVTTSNDSIRVANCYIQDQTNNEITDAVIVGSDKATVVTGANLDAKLNSIIGNDFYIRLPINTTYTSVKLTLSGNVKNKNITYWSVPANQVSVNQPIVIVSDETVRHTASGTIQIERNDLEFDLALRKFITKINDQAPAVSREPQLTQVYLSKLATKTADLDNGTTSTKTHTKDPLEVKTGDKVLYTIRIYNEGELDGEATEITDYLPSGLRMIPNSQSTINNTYGWVMYDSNNQVTTNPENAVYIKTNYLQNETLTAFNSTPTGDFTIDYADVQVECEVVATTSSTTTHLKNVAEITATHNERDVDDRDSVPNNLTDTQKSNYEPGTSTVGKGYQDDDDYEDLVLIGKFFDLSLRKFMVKINDTELKTNGKYDREPRVDVSPLTSGSGTTANYYHQKKAISVSANDEVYYVIRVYNEGQVDGYVDEIVDHLPPELEFVNDEFNAQYGWTIDSADTTQRTIRTTILSKQNDVDNVLRAFKKNDTTGQYPETLDYKDVIIKCKVKATAPTGKEITNIAEITASSNDFNLVDRDNEALVTLPSDEDLPAYKGNVDNKEDLSDSDYFYKGQKNTTTFEDDDDFEKIILEKFDLALRKFITAVNDEAITNRIPQVDTSKYGTIVDGKEVTTFEYNHTKDPVRVCQNDIVTYTIRVYNEGTKSGYAQEIKDDIPEGLLFLPEHDLNSIWKMLDESGNETTDVNQAKYISTDALSKGKETTSGENLLRAFNAETMQNSPAYLDVKVAFKVTEPNTSDRIITNQAQISEDADEEGNDVNDIDSTPDVWIEGEDDQDVEHIYVKYFDLALRKWVTHAIVIEDGVEKVMETGHYAEQDPEPVVKVEVNKKRIENTVIKFKYSIRITNEGEIAGYATEISDYIPEGLEFNKADNPDWTEKSGKIVTDKLKNTRLEPGQAAYVDVILTWINDENNMGVKVNVAEISEDKNDSNTPDIDSTPNNKKEGEDDIDDAPVALYVVSGSTPTYIAIIGATLLIVAGGLFLIKKYVI